MRRLSLALRLTLWYFAVFVLAESIFGVVWLFLRGHLSDEQRWLLLFAPVLLLLAGAVGYWLSGKALASTEQTLDRLETAHARAIKFNADASREVRIPIWRIRTMAEQALRRSQGDEEYREALRHILLEAERTVAMIDELLSLTRADLERGSLDLQPLDLRNTLVELASGWRSVAGVRGLQFSERLLDAELRVLADDAALRRVVNVLLDNAFKYTPAPGGSVLLSAEAKGDLAVISVRDTGIGIAEEDQKRIFERFYRVEKARSRELAGAGLGLAIAQSIVQQHRGRISVESMPGSGSIFRVELPLAGARVRKEVVAG
jgi:two-component system, OmpR family, manganese sensing sensor histidine kinase